MIEGDFVSNFLICSTENYLDCLLVACLRRFQQWSYVSILSEFRQHTWPHKLFDFEQLIEHFDTNKVSVPSTLPDYVITHITLQVCCECQYVVEINVSDRKRKQK